MLESRKRRVAALLVPLCSGERKVASEDQKRLVQCGCDKMVAPPTTLCQRAKNYAKHGSAAVRQLSYEVAHVEIIEGWAMTRLPKTFLLSQ